MRHGWRSFRDGLIGDPWRKRVLLHVALFSLLFGSLLVAYLPGFRAPFYYDDFVQIVENPSTRFSPGDLRSYLIGTFSPGKLSDRGIAFLSFGLNWNLGGNEPWGFRVVNLVFHMGSALALWMLLRLVFSLGSSMSADSGFGRWFPLTVSTFWAVNPTHTQSITYIVQRMNVGMTFFCLASLCSFVKALTAGTPASRASWGFLTTALGILSFGFKQNAVLLPFLMLSCWILFGASASNRGEIRRGKGKISVVLLLASGWTVMLLYWGARKFGALDIGWEVYLKRWMTQSRVIVHYIGLFFLPFPSRLHLNYSFPVSDGLFSPATTAPAILVFLSMVGGVICFSSRDRWISFGLAWFLISVLPESVLPSLHEVFEHRLYLPSIGLSIVFLRVLILAQERIQKAVGRSLDRPILIILSVAFVSLVSATYLRNLVWANPARFWDQEMKWASENPDAILGKMASDVKTGRYELVVQMGEKALEKDLPVNVQAGIRTNLALAYGALGNWDRMRESLESTIRTFGERKQEVYNLGVAYFRLGRFDRAKEKFRRLLELDPGNSDAHFFLGQIEVSEGEPKVAIAHFSNAIRGNPLDMEALAGLESMLMKMGEWELASQAAIQLEEIGGAGFLSMAHLARAGYIHLKAGRMDLAESSLRRYLAMHPDDTESNYNLACVFSRKGAVDQAIPLLDRAIDKGLRIGVIFSDPDLEAVRRSPRFTEMVRKHKMSDGGD